MKRNFKPSLIPTFLTGWLLLAGPAVAEESAAEFLARAEIELAALGQFSERNAWVYQNFITGDTELLAAKAAEQFTAAQVRYAREAAHYAAQPDLAPEIKRKLDLLRTGIVVPAPSDPALIAEQAGIGASLGGIYGKGKYCRSETECLDIGQISEILAQSRDPAELLEVWNGWHAIAEPMQPLYARQVELGNAGARELGYANLGEMWRANYDMPAAEFPAELDRLWGQVRPLYESLHCSVRAALGQQYGTELVPETGPIPAHLLGNLWAQSWDNVYPLLAPTGDAPAYDLTAILTEKGFDDQKMVATGEAFFSSLGFENLPATFWERSLFVQPTDREVVCHASAWDIDEQDDLRIKMCIKVNAEDFSTVHHELGHNYYQRAYKQHTYLHRNSANDGFHEAVGDAVALSITPEYLQGIGLLESVPDASGDTGLLLKQALVKVAFLPFGLLVDQWRWKVFAGEIGPEDYNRLWWELREQYQGVKAPDQRPATAFDPGAKFHVPGNVPYTRYFLAAILQFQFHRALCEASGNTGPIHRCSIYGNEEAGKRLQAMLAMGRSQPWQDALEALTGQREMDATAMLDYFAPLKQWLDAENQGRNCGW